MKPMKRVYVAGPYTKGTMAFNIRQAIEAADCLIGLGFAPFIPHLYFLSDLAGFYQDYETWMDVEASFLETCEFCVRLPGVSAGADREVAFCKERGIPVYTMEEVRELYDQRTEQDDT